MKMQISQSVAVCVAMLSWFGVTGANATITTNLYENFDSTAVGSMPAGWTFDAGNNYVTNNLSVSAPNSLFQTNPGGGVYLATKGLSPVINSNSTVFTSVSYDVLLKQTNRTIVQKVLNEGTLTVFGVDFNPDGTFSAVSGPASDLSLGTYVADTWYHVEMSLWPVYHAYNIEVSTNNTVIASATGLGFRGNDRNLASLRFLNISTGGMAYYDNALVFQDTSIVPEPAAVTLLLAGATLVWLKRRQAGAGK